jgi:uncharacterized coiled-coil protein SlyX
LFQSFSIAQTETERLSPPCAGRVQARHKRLDDQEERFDQLDDNLASVRAELKQLRTELEVLTEKVDTIPGYRKEIAQALERIAGIFPTSR